MAVLIIILPLLIYMIAALTVKKGVIKHPDDYFTAFRKVGETEFTSSSIAYGFQVSTIYPFLFWGASLFLLVPIVNSICWGLGILLFYFSLNKVSNFLGKGKTLHGLLGEKYGLETRIIASCLTIVGFIGYIIAELWFGSRVLLAILPNKVWLYVSVFTFIIFIATYLYKSGQISSIITDQLQLIFTYFGIFGLIIYLLYLIIKEGIVISGELTWGMTVISALAVCILTIRKMKFIRLARKVDIILNVIVTVFFMALIILALIILINNTNSIGVGSLVNLKGFGIAGLFSLILLPLCWQFVDLTNWQRLLSVETQKTKSKVNENIKRGILDFSIESPFTWLLFIVFGMLITTSFPNVKFNDILIDFPQEMIRSYSYVDQFFGYIFIVSVISIMLSTIDSFFMGISFTFIYDIYPKSRKSLDMGENIDIIKTNKIVRMGKLFGFCSIMLALLLFVFFDINVEGGGELFINLLLTFYSATLSLFPLVFCILFFKHKPNQKWALASMLIGSMSGIIVGIYAVLFAPMLAWYPIILSISLSIIVFLIGMGVNKNGKK